MCIRDSLQGLAGGPPLLLRPRQRCLSLHPHVGLCMSAHCAAGVCEAECLGVLIEVVSAMKRAAKLKKKIAQQATEL
eukprot:3465479-Rhodomonas_salina.1